MKSDKKVTIKDLRIFSLILSLILGLLSLKLFRLGNAAAGGVLLLLSASALATGLFIPVLMMPAYRLLSFIGKVIGTVISTAILSIVFYCVFTLIGVILKGAGRDILGLKMDKEKATYWHKRKTTAAEKASLERQF